MKDLDHAALMAKEAQIARDTLERYSGSSVDEFCSRILLTNFPKYVEYFAASRNIKVHAGSTFTVAHSPDEDITMLDCKVGSPVAALVVDLCSFLPVQEMLLLGMCGGLRQHYKAGDYFVPVAAIRGEGTSDYYFPPEVPAMANFLIQRGVTEVLQDRNINHHIGITYTTNIRMWEFNQAFRQRLRDLQPQAIEMECGTLFTAAYKYRLAVGALLLVSDLPFDIEGIKTKQSSKVMFERHMAEHVHLGLASLDHITKLLKAKAKGNAPRKGRYEAYLEAIASNSFITDQVK